MLRGIVLALCLLGASGIARADAEYGVPFWLGYGGSTPVGPDGLVVGFAELVAESRCPLDVWCFWEGDAEVMLSAEGPTFAVAHFTLHTYPGFEVEKEIAAWRIRLLAVTPYPQSIDIPPVPAQYRVQLHVEPLAAVATSRSTWGGIKALYR